MQPIWLAFLTGLMTGGLSCLAVQGGLLASAITSSNQGNDPPSPGLRRTKGDLDVPRRERLRIVSIFLIAKLLAYTWLGFALGAIGSTLLLTPKLMGAVQILVGLFMVATAARLLDIHPIFRYFVIQPPKWVYRALKNRSHSTSAFAPAILGFLTVLMPCGVTQATMAVAIASGNPAMGAGIMFAFVLGTSPLFFLLGASIMELLQRRAFAAAAAAVVVVFAVLSINGGLGLLGSFYTIQNIYQAAVSSPEELASGGVVAGMAASGTQEVTINVTSYGYEASAVTIKRNIPVRLTLKTNGTGGCARAFTIPDLNISKILPETGEETVEFTPTKAGRLAYSCSMGMYTGQFIVK